jgi:UDP-GlcNAc3NAcA epimerase
VQKLEEKLIDLSPDFVILYGDTNSTLARALAASKLHIPIAHIEAGLRSFNRNMPEEINRIITDKLSDLLFCPSNSSRLQLLSEGISEDKVIDSGDIMQEAFLFYQKQMKNPIEDLPDDYILCTLHRAENTDDVNNISKALNIINEINNQIPVVLSVHPRLKHKLIQNNLKLECTQIDPQPYFSMLYLLKNCRLVMTDSGGLQKEAYWSKKFCITLREETEWRELVESGLNFVTGIEIDKVRIALEKILASKTFPKSTNIYGEGNVCKKIIQAIIEKQ